MKLYSVDRSPFAARVRLAARFKGVDLPTASPPGEGIKDPAYLALNPIGKLPTLELADGRTIPESGVILDYLEAIFPSPPLVPREPFAASRAGLADRVTELYILGPLFELFAHIAPMTRDEAFVDHCFGEIRRGLELLEGFLAPGPYAVGRRPTRPDCLIAPTMFWVDQVTAIFARPNPADGLPVLAGYLAFAQGEPILGLLREEMAQDLAALRART